MSIGTASDALNGSERVSERTRLAVMRAADELGYIPNAFGSMLRKRQAPVIALVFSSFNRPGEYAAFLDYWAELIRGATVRAAELGYAILLLPKLEKSSFSGLPLAAIVLVDELPQSEDLNRAAAIGVPIFCGTLPEPDNRVAAEIDSPTASMIKEGLGHLWEQGARRPALLFQDSGTVFFNLIRDSYLAWCRDRSIEPILLNANLERDGTTLAISTLLKSPADSVFTTAGGSLQIEEALRASGKVLGADFKLLAMDEDSDGELARAGISSIEFNADQVGERSIEAIVRILDGDLEARRVELPVSTHWRASTTGETPDRRL